MHEICVIYIYCIKIYFSVKYDFLNIYFSKRKGFVNINICTLHLFRSMDILENLIYLNDEFKFFAM